MEKVTTTPEETPRSQSADREERRERATENDKVHAQSFQKRVKAAAEDGRVVTSTPHTPSEMVRAVMFSQDAKNPFPENYEEVALNNTAQLFSGRKDTFVYMRKQDASDAAQVMKLLLNQGVRVIQLKVDEFPEIEAPDGVEYLSIDSLKRQMGRDPAKETEKLREENEVAGEDE